MQGRSHYTGIKIQERIARDSTSVFVRLREYERGLSTGWGEFLYIYIYRERERVDKDIDMYCVCVQVSK